MSTADGETARTVPARRVYPLRRAGGKDFEAAGLPPHRAAASVFAVPSWFATRLVAPGVHLIAEPFHVNSYMVEGTESRVHVDTGLGVADIREAGDALSDRAPHAANTHHHFDHIGGNDRFQSIAVHELGVDLMAADRIPR
jgi:glyoxylase-like metal-dependent hydrolase (beta-lactamase superfamily II)